MSKQSDQKEPADKPAPVAQWSEIESDRASAIGDQVRAAVRNVLNKGGSVSATQLAKWGPDGTEFFFRVLRKGITKQMAMLSPPASAAASPKPVRAAGGNATSKTKQAAQRAAAGKATSSSLPVSADRNWTDQQRNRWSARRRAILHGLIVAVMLFVGTAVFTRLWGALAPLIQQQIQNWR
ncbi:hypothetical protein [Bradyrhizobium japonicum]|jgi:hypothetical protein|uniref:Uncharacterized protein n=1 Tax=Bradyrhizobium japonicum TaxID=375 RepID=A0ABV2RW26_BRAJP|nr:hypothetical protein [Bradyrhizobium japonicum]MCP1761718.1 hypothetical protein [Bradyrhizobium japonicum]MCP1793298.1 hypothetical protein [Bradyrhizobium japonicum]MCP1805731.1 hypothetical protein [Bradyrhizobium japonicum]MCP1814748.1 hypothetical protein [Bradyrhizobium japonicum]MCP1873823.1 hypothetical protein [Bradyrhizobium japonicum]